MAAMIRFWMSHWSPWMILIAAAALLPAQHSGHRMPPRIELLYPQGAPDAVGQEEIDKPSLTYFLADRKVATGVIVCPGGGYRTLALEHEGNQIAEWLNSLGISAFVLKYRLGPRYRHPAMLRDAQRAIRMVRSQASQLGLAPDRIGIWGFSAGGHLASTAATHFDDGNPASPDPVERFSSRPDFAILAYPVISLVTEYAHAGSKRHLLGENPDDQQLRLLSNELQVSARTPPTFLFHTHEDQSVPPENSVLFYLALRKAGVPAELHIYEKGRHGLGLAATDATLSSWPARLADWLRVRGLLR
ncbi:MAG: alpha/beta hydrolase [Bryobacteraceae bacterium]|nr:alpha/beta hydrolase [Bryobacteraceae bacterium]MDW8376832.1 alpha/beta hydrolase [Bryobacterales bacterium]